MLSAALDRARGGEGGIVAVTGEPGVGKTSLVRALGRRARETGLLVLDARAPELESDLALGALARLLDGPGQLPGPLTDAAAAIVAAPGVVDPDYGVPHLLTGALAAAAEERPVLVALDDAQWADRASLRALHFVASRAEGVALLVAVATRTDALNGALPELDALVAMATVVRPRPLTHEGVAALIASTAGGEAGPEVVAACRDASGGNPFLLTELVGGLVDDGVDLRSAGAEAVGTRPPESIVHSVLFRLGRLTEDAGRVARAVAVLGDAAPVHHVAAVAGLGVDAVLPAGAELSRAGVFDIDRPVSFAHPLIAGAVRAELDPHEQSAAHARAADALVADGASVVVVAGHLLHTVPAGKPDTVAALRAAAGQALAVGAAPGAATLLARALAEPPTTADRGDVLTALGGAELGAGDPASAAVHLREGLGLAASPQEMVQRAVALSGAVLLSHGIRAGHDVLVEALRRLPDDEPDLWLVLTAHEVQLCLFDALDADLYARAWERLGQVRPPDPGTPAGRAVLAMLACREVFFGGTAAAASALARQALDGGRLADDASGDAIPFGIGVFAAVEAGQLDLAEQEIARARQAAQRRGSPRTLAVIEISQVVADERRGSLRRVDETIAVARMALDAELASPLRPVFGAYLDAVESSVRAEAGDAARADALAPSEDVGNDGNALRMLPWRIRSAFALGRTADAERGVAAVRRFQEETGIDWDPSSPWRAWQAVALASARHHAEARAMAEAELERAAHWGTAHALGVALCARGLAEPGPEGIAWLDDAVAAFAGAGGVHLARAQVELGAAMRRAGRRTDARGPLTAGLDTAVAAGATVLADRAREELRLAGARPRRERTTGVDALTAAERRVAAMAADGLTNREVAQALFVSAKTVEGHLRQAYAKLGITGRAGLREALPAEPGA